MSTALAKIEKARQLLAECQTIDDAKSIRDQAEAVRVYCRQQADSLDAQNYAAEIKLRAERKCGELLAEMGKKTNQNGAGNTLLPALSDLGIGKMQSHRWQLEASIPEEHFESFIRSTHEGGKELTSAGLYKLGKKLNAAKEEAVTIPIRGETRAVNFLTDLDGEKFGCIYADPPWKYGNQGTRAATDNHYLTLSVDELCEWPIKDYVADDAHLHLWTTNAFLPGSFKLIEAWGFEYRSCFVWVKPQMGIGNYWRVSHEFLLLGIRGNAKRFRNKSLMSWGQYGRAKHSAKPEEIRGMIEKASDGPYLELFGRKQVDGWTVLGNKIEERLFA